MNSYTLPSLQYYAVPNICKMLSLSVTFLFFLMLQIVCILYVLGHISYPLQNFVILPPLVGEQWGALVEFNAWVWTFSSYVILCTFLSCAQYVLSCKVGLIIIVSRNCVVMIKREKTCTTFSKMFGKKY